MKIRSVRIDEANVHASCPQCSWPASGHRNQVAWRLEAHLTKVHGVRDPDVTLSA